MPESRDAKVTGVNSFSRLSFEDTLRILPRSITTMNQALPAYGLDQSNFPTTATSSNLKNLLSSIKIDPDVRPEAVNAIQNFIEQLPPKVIQAFIDSKLKIVVVAFIELNKPNNIDKFSAYYKSEDHLVVLSDKAGWRNFLTDPFNYEPMPTEDVKHYCSHELGHALHGACMGREMYVPLEVQEAHRHDIAELSKEKRSEYFYYIQGAQNGGGYLDGLTNEEGRLEVIAQGFSALWGDSKIPNFIEDFPRTCISILKHIAGYTAEEIESNFSSLGNKIKGTNTF